MHRDGRSTQNDGRESERVILHLDMDAFFAAVEQRDDPSLRGRPVLVGGDPGGRGVVAAASYEARSYGIGSAMPMAQALRRCPHAVVRRGRYEVYRSVSQQIRTLARHVTPRVEPLALDEMFLDVSSTNRRFDSVEEIGRFLKRRIGEECDLTASVGIAPVKSVAKLACNRGKPDGLFVVAEEDVLDFLGPLSVRELWGVGEATFQRLRPLGIETIEQLRRLPVETLEIELGKLGRHIWELAHGIDPRPVEPHRPPKSVSHETTFARDLTDPERLLRELQQLTEATLGRLHQSGWLATSLQLKIRLADFRTFSRSTAWKEPRDDRPFLWRRVLSLWQRFREDEGRPIRLLGVGVSGLRRMEARQLLLWEED